MKIAFATHSKEPLLTEDDKVLADYLSSKQIKVIPAVWDAAQITWLEFDAIIIRSTWDYFEKTDQFFDWLDKIENSDCRVFNQASVIKWNLDKKYLMGLQRHDIMVPAFEYCIQNQSASLHQIMQSNKWETVVVKPAISCGAFKTWIATTGSLEKDGSEFSKMLVDGDVIVQQFMPEIATNGELSLMFFNKEYSHSILKKPAVGDFRIQAKFGGTFMPINPAPDIIKQAAAILDAITEPLLYARVDGVIAEDGQFYLMEIEVFEPQLWVKTNDKAPDNFYHALMKLI